MILYLTKQILSIHIFLHYFMQISEILLIFHALVYLLMLYCLMQLFLKIKESKIKRKYGTNSENGHYPV